MLILLILVFLINNMIVFSYNNVPLSPTNYVSYSRVKKLFVDIYNIEVVHIKSYATVSKRSWICTASHNIDNPRHELITGSITIGHYVWVAGEAFVGPGVTLHDGCVVGTRATMLTDGKPWYVFGGVPAKAIRKRGFEKTPNE